MQQYHCVVAEHLDGFDCRAGPQDLIPNVTSQHSTGVQM